MPEKSVIILPETDDRAICVTYANVVKKDDYLVFHELMEKVFSETGRLRIFVYFDESFKGWEPEAAEVNILSVSIYAARAEKIAYVNPEARKVFQMKLSAPMMRGQIRFFDQKDYQEAMEWVKAA